MILRKWTLERQERNNVASNKCLEANIGTSKFTSALFSRYWWCFTLEPEAVTNYITKLSLRPPRKEQHCIEQMFKPRRETWKFTTSICSRYGWYLTLEPDALTCAQMLSSNLTLDRQERNNVASNKGLDHTEECGSLHHYAVSMDDNWLCSRKLILVHRCYHQTEQALDRTNVWEHAD